MDITFFAKPKRNMKNKLMRLTDKLLSRKRSILETIIDQFKKISQIEHSRHRSLVNFLVNVVCELIARMPPAQKAFPPHGVGFTVCCLTRTEVILP